MLLSSVLALTVSFAIMVGYGVVKKGPVAICGVPSRVYGYYEGVIWVVSG